MVTVTEKAAEKGKEILAAEGKHGWGIRIYNAGSGCCGPSFGLDIDENPLADDDVVEKNGLRVFVEKSLSPNLVGMQLDYLEGEEHEGFVLNGGGSAPSCSSGCSSCG
ncbi:MAG: iron-sulfur cluster assembly accessory protein [Nitrospirae bacterium]|nr:MAG: iron-sulfur cluster assembly accessory protein [Nitrospirota bacterium]